MDINAHNFLEVWKANQSEISISKIKSHVLEEKNIELHVLRLDAIHPFISGNKWYKLKYNLQQLFIQEKNTALSFGGAYSNHLHALAYAGKLLNIKTIGIIRGEEVKNKTVNDCQVWGMELHFIARHEYKHKNETHFISEIQNQFPSSCIIPEGGNNELGIKGCSEILEGINLSSYSHVACAVGTGATITGLLQSLPSSIQLLAFSALKKCDDIKEEVSLKFPTGNIQFFEEKTFGGFAKSNVELEKFMREFYQEHTIELDKVYTAKLFFTLFSMIKKGEIPPNSKLLVLHTGGLQGN